MIQVGLAETDAGYTGLVPPYHPGVAYPELHALFGEAPIVGRPNGVYAAVRAALLGAGLDAHHFGTPSWNPLGALVGPGKRVVLKPNFIRHWNPSPEGTVASVVTHGSVIRAIADYALLAVGRTGSVELAEASQQDCDFAVIRELAGLDVMQRFFSETARRTFAVIDLRREAVVFRDGIIVSR